MIEIGQTASYSKTITEEDINTFAILTGDRNPIHINEEKAERSVFGRRVAHGMLSASLISTVLGIYLPGEGVIYLSQNITFTKPVYIGDTVKARVVVTDIMNVEKGIYRLKTECLNQNEEIVIDGEAVVKYMELRG